MPENVHSFSQKIETKVLQTTRGEIVHLYGFSYPQRHVYERKIDEYQKMEGADFHIGILHGNEGGSHDHDNYAPFSVKDLQQKGFDYWALGHIHKRTILSENPPIIYPGNIQGRNKKETGPKGFYFVELTEEESKLEFIESSDIFWEEAVVDATAAESFHDVFLLCQSEINRLRKTKAGTFLSLTLQNVQLNDYREKRSLNDELFELLLEDEKDEESFVQLVDLTITEKVSVDKEKLKKEANFYAELFQTAEDYDASGNALASLYEHQLGRRFLSPLSTDEQQEIVKKAEQLLVRLLSQ